MLDCVKMCLRENLLCYIYIYNVIGDVQFREHEGFSGSISLNVLYCTRRIPVPSVEEDVVSDGYTNRLRR